MKGTRLRTLRGSIDTLDGNIKKQLILDDGRPNHGLRILDFQIWTDNLNPVGGGSFTLSMEVITPAAMFNAEDNRQIAWAAGGYDNNVPVAVTWRTIVDPDHIINRDLFLNGFCSVGRWNYLITCQEYILSDEEAVISIIKETAQSVGTD